MNGKVGIVVVTFNRLNLLKEEIEALRKQTYSNFQIVVVNNGSTDETLNWLAEQNDLYIITQANVGGAGGFYTGMKYVAEHDFDFCWIMDDDVICDSTALDELVKANNIRNNIGFVCSRVIGIDGNPMNTPVVDDSSINGGYSNWLHYAPFGLIKVKEATFVSVLFSTDIIREMGLPYKEYFIWGDDTEYTMRISSKYDCFVAFNSCVMHKRAIQQKISLATETNSNRLKMHYYRIRNSLYNMKKYYSKKEMRMMRNNLLKLSFRYLIRFDLTRARIIFNAVIDSLNFEPKIEFPEK